MPVHGERRNIREETSHGEETEFTDPAGNVVWSGPVDSFSQSVSERWCTKCEEWVTTRGNFGAVFCPQCYEPWKESDRIAKRKIVSFNINVTSGGSWADGQPYSSIDVRRQIPGPYVVDDGQVIELFSAIQRSYDRPTFASMYRVLRAQIAMRKIKGESK